MCKMLLNDIRNLKAKQSKTSKNKKNTQRTLNRPSNGSEDFGGGRARAMGSCDFFARRLAASAAGARVEALPRW